MYLITTESPQHPEPCLDGFDHVAIAADDITAEILDPALEQLLEDFDLLTKAAA